MDTSKIKDGPFEFTDGRWVNNAREQLRTARAVSDADGVYYRPPPRRHATYPPPADSMDIYRIRRGEHGWEYRPPPDISRISRGLVVATWAIAIGAFVAFWAWATLL